MDGRTEGRRDDGDDDDDDDVDINTTNYNVSVFRTEASREGLKDLDLQPST